MQKSTNLNVHFTSQYDKWTTPNDLIEKIKTVYPIDLDLAASTPNVCSRFYSKTDDGLSQPWDGVHNWLNPPYGRKLKKWAAAVRRHVEAGAHAQHALLILTPVRSDTKWWMDMTVGSPVLCLQKGRLKFGDATFWTDYWNAKRLAMTNESEKSKSKIITNGNPAKPAPFPTVLIYHGPLNPELFSLMNELGQVWKMLEPGEV